MTTLSSKALLANLRIGQWSARKFDKRATGTVEAAHATRGHVGNYTKKLLPGAAELEKVQRIASSIRNFFYDQTLPWATDGSRILSSKNYLDFTAAFRSRKAEFDSAVADFIAAYPALRETARTQLGDLFSESEYPSEVYLRTAFTCEVGFMPLPDVGDFRVSIHDDTRDAFIAQMKATESAAMRECWDRLYSVVSKAAQRLSEPEAIFRDSLLENISELCELLPKLNVLDDANLETARTEIESIVSRYNPDDLRDKANVRTEAAKQLDEAVSKMSAFMGT